MKKRKLLVVDDDQAMRLALAESLESCGYQVEAAENGLEALQHFERGGFDLVLTDMKMPGMTGIEVLRSVKKMSPAVPVILVTAYGTVGTAVEAMKEGAAEFIMKPFTLEEIEAVVGTVLRAASEASPPAAEPPSSPIVSRDPKMLAILEMLANVAKSKSSVLIQGESGTGKELIARYIHQHSQRRQNPFVAVNCAAIPHSLLESEMFGYERGAFTGAAQRKLGRFELAHTGTLLLDEVSEMDTQLQAKLLRVLQEGEVDRLGGQTPIAVDVRIVATTNVQLAEAIAERRFRSDLYYRLNVIPVKIPPLRERNGDIPLLANHFLETFWRERGGPRPQLSEKALALLKAYPFPGNVRELENIMERAVLMTTGRTITPEAFCLDHPAPAGEREVSPPLPEVPAPPSLEPGLTLKEVEKTLICETLGRVAGNKTKAAKMLGISVRTLWNKVHEYGMADGQDP